MKLENLDFERGDAFWQETQIGAGTSAVQTNSANARSGSKYLLLSKAAVAGYPTAMASVDSAGVTAQYMPVIPGQIIQFGGWMYRESGANAAWVAMEATDVNKANPVYTNVQQDGTTGSWKFYSGTYKVPAGKVFLRFYLQTDTAVAATSVRFDDVYCSAALDVQVTHVDTGVSYPTDQTAYLRAQSLTLKLNTFDFQLVDPVVVPVLGDTVAAADPNLALAWSGTVAKVSRKSVSERGGHTYVTVSATNQVVAIASVAPFDLGGSRNRIPDPGFEDADLTAVQTMWGLSTPGEFSLDTTAGNFHGGAKALKCTTTRTATGWNPASPIMAGSTQIGASYFFPVAPGMTYAMSIWAKAAAGSKANHFKIAWYKDAGVNASDIKTQDQPMGGTDGPYAWTQFSASVVAPQDARFAIIQVMFGFWDGVTGTNGQSWFDDISFVAAAAFREMGDDATLDKSGATKTAVSCLTLQPGLWPIQTTKVTNSDYGLVNQDFTVVDTTVTWPVLPGNPVFKIDLGDPIVTMAAWLGSSNAGILPIDSTKITDGAVTTPKIAANAVTAAQIAAGSVTADKLTAILVLASLIKAGTGVAHVEMDGNGLRAFDGSGNLVVNIPTDGVSPVTINANVVAASLVSTGNAILQGAKSEVALNAALQLDATQQDPSQAPSVAQTWATVTLPINSTYDTSSSVYTRVGLDYDSAGGAGGATKTFWQVTKKGSGTEYALELLASDRTVNRTIDLTGAGFKTPLSICRLGSFVYVLGLDGSTGSAADAGYQGAATYSYNFSGAGTDDFITSRVITMPATGKITRLQFYMGGHTASVAVTLALYDSSYNLVGQTNAFTAGAGRALRSADLITPVSATAGQQFYVAFWRTSAGDAEWGVTSSGGFNHNQYSSLPGSMSAASPCSGAYVCGDVQAYFTYTPDTRVARVRRFSQSTLALDTTYAAVSYPVLSSSLPVSPAITQDGTNVYIVDRLTTVKWQKYDTAMATVGGVIDTTYNPGANVGDAQAGNGDFGAFRMVVTAAAAVVDSYDSTGARQTNEQWTLPASGVGLTYGDALGDGARYWHCPTLGGAATNLTKHSTWVWTTASSVYWVAYTWYDSAGTVHETKVGPRSSITMSRRAQMVITTPGIPGGGGADDPNNIRFYTAPNATDPGAGNFKLQATQAAVTLTLTTYASGGAADPASNNYPAGTPAQISAQTGGLKIRGDSKILTDTAGFDVRDVGDTQSLHKVTGAAHHLVNTPGSAPTWTNTAGSTGTSFATGSNDRHGRFIFTAPAGGIGAGSVIGKVLYATAYGAQPFVICVQSRGQATADIVPYYAGSDTLGFQVIALAALTAGVQYAFDYIVEGAS